MASAASIGHLIVGRVTMFHPKVVGFEIDVEIRMDQALFNERPHDPRHLIAVEIHDGAGYLDLGHVFDPYQARRLDCVLRCNSADTP